MYQLVLRTIEFLTQQRQANAASAAKGTSQADGDADEALAQEVTCALGLPGSSQRRGHCQLEKGRVRCDCAIGSLLIHAAKPSQDGDLV